MRHLQIKELILFIWASPSWPNHLTKAPPQYHHLGDYDFNTHILGNNKASDHSSVVLFPREQLMRIAKTVYQPTESEFHRKLNNSSRFK